MKKGDIIEKRKEMKRGSVLIRGCTSQEQAENFILDIEKHYNFKHLDILPRMTIAEIQGDKICVVLDEDTYLTIQAKVNWVVESQFAIEYLDTGGMVLLDSNLEEGLGWVVIHESTPVYQDSVEHMTDEQLRASIEELRSRRLSQPIVKVKAKMVKLKAEEQSPEDKALTSVLNSKTPEEKMELMIKLGLVD